MHWMPAHTSETSIGQKVCSDGQPFSELPWYSNQLVDLLAKEAADDIRMESARRGRLIHNEQQKFELAIYLGKLTVAANEFVTSDGTTIRDSDAIKRRQLKKHKRIVKRTSSRIEAFNKTKSKTLR